MELKLSNNPTLMLPGGGEIEVTILYEEETKEHTWSIIYHVDDVEVTEIRRSNIHLSDTLRALAIELMTRHNIEKPILIKKSYIRNNIIPYILQSEWLSFLVDEYGNNVIQEISYSLQM